MSRLSAVVQLIHGVFTGLNSSRDSSSVTSLMRPAGFPEHESVHSAPADKSRWGLPCFSGRIERNGGEDLTSCSGCGSGCCDERERESLRLAPFISARRSDTRSVDLQGTRSCRHAPQCYPCLRSERYLCFRLRTG